jgi:hypothetical protein
MTRLCYHCFKSFEDPRLPVYDERYCPECQKGEWQSLDMQMEDRENFLEAMESAQREGEEERHNKWMDFWSKRFRGKG